MCRVTGRALGRRHSIARDGRVCVYIEEVSVKYGRHVFKNLSILIVRSNSCFLEGYPGLDINSFRGNSVASTRPRGLARAATEIDGKGIIRPDRYTSWRACLTRRKARCGRLWAQSLGSMGNACCTAGVKLLRRHETDQFAAESLY